MVTLEQIETDAGGLSAWAGKPAVAIEQKNPTKTSRSTVGTATEIYDYLRLLWARVGRTICPVCGREMRPDTVQSASDELLALPAGTRFVIAFPLAYFIAFKGGRFKNLMLLLVILPFFVSYVLRTVSWQLILADNGWVVSRLKDVGLIGDDGRLLASRTAVIAGITYNFLPFMALPLYVSLEKIDRRLIEAATDLYASRATAFRKVTLPLALPGIFAGSLLTFIPACVDFINAALLGTPRQYMIGNVIQNKYLVIQDYPTAAALSFILMTFILIGIFLYARVLGARNLTEAAI